ncbi:MAG TPA: SpoIIE family protein phosphatase [Actinospica sp.]|nr:SpoIIE family protein phosphatase [Actinospica sp.]
MAHDPARRAAAVTSPLLRPLLDALSADASVAFACFGPDCRYLMVSQALAALNGLPAQEHPGRLPSEVLGPELGGQIEAAAARVLADGKSYREPEQRLRRAEWPGAVRFLDSAWTPVRGADGEVLAALAVVNDVTDRHRIADLLGSTQWRIGKLQTVARELAGALTISEVRAAVAKLGQVTGSTHVDLRLLDPVGRSPWPSPLVPPQRVARRRNPVEEDRWEWRTLSWPALLAAGVRDGRPCYLPDRAALDTRYPEASQWPAATSPGAAEQAWAVLPLSTAVGPVGGLYLVYDTPRGFDEDDRAYLQALAGQCTMAVARARMHEREHRQVVSLQEAILPKRLPQLDGVDAAFRYIPGSLDTEVGGDWYDLFGFPDGRIGLVVGDVIGKGITAAAGMGRVRAALRALAFTDPSPAAVLTGLDRLFDATENAESLTTVVYAVLDPPRGALRISDAGHLPLLVLKARGGVGYLETDEQEAATPLGLSEVRCEHEVLLEHGDVVIGFSDGLVETRDAAITTGLERLRTAACHPPDGDLDSLLDHLVDEMLRDQEQDDDVTLLAVRIGG